MADRVKVKISVAFVWTIFVIIPVSFQQNATEVDSDLTLGFAIRDYFCYSQFHQTKLQYLFLCSSAVGVDFANELIVKCPQYETQDLTRMYVTICTLDGNPQIPQHFVPALECFAKLVVPPETAESDPNAREKVAQGLRECRENITRIAY